MSRWIAALLRVPLPCKILVANSIIVGAVAVAAWLVHPGLGTGPRPEGLAAVVAIAVGVTFVVNAAIVWFALAPLRGLQSAAAAVRAGDLEARAPLSPLADRRTRELIRAFNEALEAIGEYRRRLRAMTARVLSREEEDRVRVARELHEETAQRLASLLLTLRLKSVDGDLRALEGVIEEARREIATAVETIRGFAADRQPPPLEDLGLGRAIELHAEPVAEASGVEIRVACDPVEQALTAPARLVLYRVVQEAVENAAAHARASSIEVRLERQGDEIVARVIDDGEGFAVEEAMERGGIGLFGMRERAATAGGSVEFESRPGHGTTVRLAVPVEPLRREKRV